MASLVVFSLFCLILSTSGETADRCKRKACTDISDSIQKFIDDSVDPCVDFNKFACGKWEQNAKLDTSMLTEPIHTLRRRMEKLITQTGVGQAINDTDKKIRDFYQACQVFKSNNEIQTFVQLASGIGDTLEKVGLSGWPYSNNSELSNNFKWFDVVPKMVKEGIVYADGFLELPIINVEVGVNDFTRNNYTLKIDSPNFHAFDDSESLATSSAIIAEVFEIPAFVIKRSFEINNALHRISAYSERHTIIRDFGMIIEGLEYKQYRNDTIDSLGPFTCGTMESGCNSTTWTKYFNSIFEASGNSQIKVKQDQLIINKDAFYFTHLDQVFKDLNVTSFELANYIGWKIVIDYIDTLENLEQDFGVDCVNYLMAGRPESHTEYGLLNGAVGSMYVREYWELKMKQQVEDMVDYVREAFKNIIPSINWMDGPTKSRALEKLNAMGEFIAYPKELNNKTLIDDYYHDLNISSVNHADNIMKIGQFKVRKSFSKMGQQWTSNSWTIDIHQIVNDFNAFYFPLLNEFVIAAGFLQDINYNYERPMYLNFATTGYVIGHEIIHGFDSSGRNFDKNGKYQDEPGWWSHKSNDEYNKRSQCIVNHYDNLIVEQLPEKTHVNGEHTLGENIADIGGNRLAYDAYDLWIKHNGTEEKMLTGLPYTTKQLFWIHKAHQNCAKYRTNTWRELLWDVHVPGGYRTNGPLMLSDEFARDFNCPANTPMNPKVKCSFWPDLTELGQMKNQVETPNAGFASGTFFGGMVLMLLLAVLGFVGHKYYKRRQVDDQFERTRLTSISTF